MQIPQSTINYHKKWGDQVTLDKLRNSPHYREVDKSDIINALQEAAVMYQTRPSFDTFGAWAQKLVDYKISPDSVRKACAIVPTRFDRFPSFNEFYQIISGITSKKVEEKVDPEADKLRQIYAKWIAVIGQEAMIKLGQGWLLKVANLSEYEVKSWGLSARLFAMVACKDLDVIGKPQNKAEWDEFWIKARNRHEIILKNKA
jgi:hypothetical protein